MLMHHHGSLRRHVSTVNKADSDRTGDNSASFQVVYQEYAHPWECAKKRENGVRMILYILLSVMIVVLTAFAMTRAGWEVFFRRFNAGARLRIAFVAVMLVALIAVFALMIHWYTEVLTSVGFLGLIGLLVLLLKQRIASTTPTTTARTYLAVGAHPDDLEIACGGTLSRLCDEGHHVHAIIMSDGRAGGDNGVRPDEARTGASTMGLCSIEIHSLTDTMLDHHSVEMVQIIEEKINQIHPDVIFTHSIHDQHQDHQAVHLAVLRAARKHPSILCYESPSVTSEFSPQLFVDITNYLDIKVKAVADHRDQAGKRYLRHDRLRGTANFRGAQGKVELAEGFEVVRIKDSIAGLT